MSNILKKIVDKSIKKIDSKQDLIELIKIPAQLNF